VTSQDDKTIIELKTELERLEKVYPKIMRELKKIIGEENWQDLKTKAEDLKLNFHFPSLLDAVKEIQKSRSSFIDKGNKHYLTFVSKT
jgi:hypothetical protein